MLVTNVDTTTAAAPPPRGRLILGGAIFMVGLLCPLLIPLVAASNLPAGWKATLSGVLLLGIPELFMLTAAGVLGQSGFHYLKSRLFAFFGRHVRPQVVSRRRYRVGLVLFLPPILWGWLTPYVSQ